MDIFGVQVMCFVLDWTGRLGLTFTTGLFIRFAAKREKQLNPFFMAQPSLFFPYFDFTLMNVYIAVRRNFTIRKVDQQSRPPEH